MRPNEKSMSKLYVYINRILNFGEFSRAIESVFERVGIDIATVRVSMEKE